MPEDAVEDLEAAFVPLAVETEIAAIGGDAAVGAITIEIGGDVVLRVPGDVSLERAASLVRALRGVA